MEKLVPFGHVSRLQQVFRFLIYARALAGTQGICAVTSDLPHLPQ